jgi:hypothetical protein
MLDLTRVVINHFDSKNISDFNLRKFAEITWERLKANNPAGVYDQLIADMAIAYTDYFGSLSTKGVKMAKKEGSTIAMSNALKDFKEAIRQKEGIVRGIFGLDSAVYQEFFPHGLTEYARLNLGNVETIMSRVISVATLHQAEVGADFVALFTNLKSNFVEKREAQLKLMGDVKGKKHATAENRTKLEIQLMKVVLTVALNNVGNRDAMKMYFDQSFLKNPKKKAEPETVGI